MRPHLLLEFPQAISLVMLCAATLVGGVSCEAEQGDDDDDTTDLPAGDLTLDLTLSEVVPTVALVSWQADVADLEEAYVEFGPTSEYGAYAPMEFDGEGTFSGHVLGMKAGTEYRLRATLVADGQTLTSGEYTLTTGLVPTEFPDLTVGIHEVGETAGGYVVMSLLSQTPIMAILDRDGDFVWWYKPEGETYLAIRATLSRDGKSILFMGTYAEQGGGGNGDEDEDERYLVRVSIDGTQVDIYQVDGAHHDFVELSDGGLAFIGSESREVPQGNISGATIVELSPDGTEEVVWTVWDVLEFDPDYMDGGWTHANALDYDAGQEAFYLSIRNYDSILKIDRASGDVLWTIGGPFSDFEDDSGNSGFWDGQHQFDVLEDSIVVFDNQPAVPFTSRVVEMAFDEADGSTEFVWSYQPDPPFYCFGLGDANRLPNGHTLVTWSVAAQMEEVTPDGELVWQLNSALGAGFGYTTWLDTLYP